MKHRLIAPLVVIFLAAACDRRTNPRPENTVERAAPGTPATSPSQSVAPSGTVTTADTGSMNGAAAPAGTASTGAAAMVAPLNDSQIARITNDANTAEVEQGKLAQSKAKDARVKKFAERMVKHHTEAKDKQAKLKLQPATSDLALKLAQDADSSTRQLKSGSAANFDSGYITVQVKEHRQVLDTLDQQLIPSAKSDDLKDYLKDMRETVETHLKDAQDIQSKLGEQSSKLSQQAPSR